MIFFILAESVEIGVSLVTLGVGNVGGFLMAKIEVSSWRGLTHLTKLLEMDGTNADAPPNKRIRTTEDTLIIVMEEEMRLEQR